jgi:Tol biopolymer transport system component
MSTTVSQVGRWASVALAVLYGAYERSPIEASDGDLVQLQTVGFTVEAASFADGGQGCWQGPFYCGGAYYDETPGNWGDAQVRPGTDVDLWYDDGGIVIGGLDGLEWLTFPVTVPQGGRYQVTFRTASPADRPAGSGVVNVGAYGVDGSWLGNRTVPITGGPGEWHQYVAWQAPTTIYLPGGPQTLTMWAAGGYYNVRSITFTLVAPVTKPAGDIVFVSTRDGNPEIYSVGTDGTDLTRLTNNPANDDAPVWSPDGKRIAFASDRDGSPEIYVMNADGTDIVRRTFSASFAQNPTWSPDGTKIAYSTLSDGSANIWVIHPDVGGPTLLFSQPGWEGHPAWSPDGTKLALVSDWYGYDLVFDIFLINPDGSGFTGLTNDIFNFEDYYQPSWSPDGSKIAVAITQRVAVDEYTEQLVTTLGVMNANGTDLTPLVSAATYAKSSWSPDGTTIAFTSWSAGALNISWVSATDGSKSGTIVTNGYSPDWGVRSR